MNSKPSSKLAAGIAVLTLILLFQLYECQTGIPELKHSWNKYWTRNGRSARADHTSTFSFPSSSSSSPSPSKPETAGVLSSESISQSQDWVRRQDAHHVAEAIDTLLNMDTISFDHEESGHLIPADLMISASADIRVGERDTFNHRLNDEESKVDSSPTSSESTAAVNRGGGEEVESGADTGEGEAESVTFPTSNPSSDFDVTLETASANIVSGSEASLSIMNRTFNEIFTRPRSDDQNPQLKEAARNAVINRMRELKIDAFTQAFTAMKRGIPQKGTNLIGILPGRFRDLPSKDRIVLVGAHYDTVSTSPGIDDNASGMVVLLELARILSSQPQLNHTVMFVGFDLEELGLLGSAAFVREYLIPNELLAKKATFLGAYVIDMALHYNPNIGAQTLPRDIMTACPGVTAKISQDGNRGDFIAVWVRKGVDGEVYKSLVDEWKGSSKFKLRTFDPTLPSSTPSASDLYRFGTFTRSDHASFWYHKHPDYKQTLNAVLLTDMGMDITCVSPRPWRGAIGSKCYHNWCDDTSQLTDKNLKFLKNTIDSLAGVLIQNPPGAPPVDSKSTPPSPKPTFGSRGVPGDDRGSRTNRGRGGPNRFRPTWPSFPSSFPSPFPPIYGSPGISYPFH